MLFDWTVTDIEKARKNIAYRLLSAGFELSDTREIVDAGSTETSGQEVNIPTSEPEVCEQPKSSELLDTKGFKDSTFSGPETASTQEFPNQTFVPEVMEQHQTTEVSTKDILKEDRELKVYELRCETKENS